MLRALRLVVFYDLHITDTRMTLERLGGFKIGNLRTTTKFTTTKSVDWQRTGTCQFRREKENLKCSRSLGPRRRRR